MFEMVLFVLKQIERTGMIQAFSFSFAFSECVNNNFDLKSYSVEVNWVKVRQLRKTMQILPNNAFQGIGACP